MDFIKAEQLDIMLFMSGICFILTFMTLMIKSLPCRRKSILTLMELSAMMLLLFDRLAYIHDGDVSSLGYHWVRISNGMVFFLVIFILHLVTQYLKDVCRNEGKLQTTPVYLIICDVLFIAGTVLVIVSQFTGLYYTFDDQNIYHRSSGFIISYIVPILIVLLQEVTIIRYRARLTKGLLLSLAICIVLPTAMSVVQVFCYGLPLISMTTVIVIIIFYIYAIIDLNRTVKTAIQNELESYKEAQRREAAMFEQTAEALASAIDAKDKNTHGHSTRVAALSKQMAIEAGFSDEDCDQIYFAALLHDVGKIGVRNDIINKAGKPTDKEFEQIKLHPILGYQILSSIKQSPALSIGAHYHHERYDGTGYPEGLSGEDIPEIARIIAVADAYDAMSSNRSYRSPLTQESIKAEFIEGRGKQFDPKYTDILLQIIDRNRT